jgi:hypothetical protein
VDFGTNTGALISRDNFVETLDVSGCGLRVLDLDQVSQQRHMCKSTYAGEEGRSGQMTSALIGARTCAQERAEDV